MTGTLPADAADRLRYLNQYSGLPGRPPMDVDDLVDAELVGTAVIDGHDTWWITSGGLALMDEAASRGYTVRWRRDSAPKTSAPGLSEEDARRHVDALVGCLRAGERISRIIVLDAQDTDCTQQVAGPVLPPLDQLAALARRAAVISGLRDAADFYATRLGVLVPHRVDLIHHVEDQDVESAHSTIYVAAAALEVAPVEVHGAMSVRREFGPVAVVVQYVDPQQVDPSAKDGDR
jgi:hypothetical protein